MDLSKALEEPVSKFMSTDYVSIPSGVSVEEAARAMMRGGSTEAVATEGGKVVGIFTERDILYKVVAAGKRPADVRVREIMTSPMATIEGSASAGDAIAKMSKLGVRRLGVTRDGKVVGLVTQKSVVTDRLGSQVVLPELNAPKQISCPYCGSVMKDAKELSKHIDDAHLRKAVLEGEGSTW
jgi:CBS domain-containing protein